MSVILVPELQRHPKTLFQNYRRMLYKESMRSTYFNYEMDLHLL